MVKKAIPRASSIVKSDFNLSLLGKVICVFVFLGPILVPLLWLSGWPLFMSIAEGGWAFGRSFCTYTVKSFMLGGVPLMVCARCTGVAFGLLTSGLLYHYTSLFKAHRPAKRLHVAAIIAALFVPWLLDSSLQRLELWLTDYWLMFPTGFLGGVALIIAPWLFLPDPHDYDDEPEQYQDTAETLVPTQVASVGVAR